MKKVLYKNRKADDCIGMNATIAKKNNMQAQPIEINARAKAFSGQGIRSHRFHVDSDGTVRVWDAIAGYYTSCHSLSRSTEARIRKLARDGRAVEDIV